MISLDSLFTIVSAGKSVHIDLASEPLNLTSFLIPQRWDEVAPFVVRIGPFVQLPQVRITIEWLFLEPGFAGHTPSLLLMYQGGIPHNQLHNLLKSFQTAHQVRTMRPRTAHVDVKGISIFLCWELRVWIRRDEAAER